jgi:hypothetical protein
MSYPSDSSLHKTTDYGLIHRFSKPVITLLTLLNPLNFINPKERKIEMKKFISLTAIAALAVGFAACSSEDDLTPQGQSPQAAGSGAFVQFTIDTNANSITTTSRADGEDGTATADASTTKTYKYGELESTDEYVQDLDIEHAVSTVYAYFVAATKDTEGNYIVDKTSKLLNLAGKDQAACYYLALSATKRLPNTSVTEYATESSTQYITDVMELAGEVELDHEYQVYLLCNKPADIPAANPTLADLLDDQLELGYGDTDESTTAAITAKGIPMAARSIDGIIYRAFTPTKLNTQENPAVLKYEVERAFARISYSNPGDKIPLYATVTDADANVSDKQIGTIAVEGYYVFNRQNQYNTYRHVGKISGESQVAYAENITPVAKNKVIGAYGPMNANNTDCAFLLDPNSHQKKTTDLSMYNSALARITKNIKWSKGDATTGNWYEYVTENSMPNAGQKKGLATGVMFKVSITPKTIREKVEGEYKAALAQKKAILYYYNGEFFGSLDALKEVLPDITADQFSAKNVKFYKNGKAYYSYYIRHMNNNDYNQMGDMEFATVRNNTYDLEIKSAAMNAFETPVTNPGGEPDPKDPTVDPDTDPDDVDPDIPDPDNGDPDPEGPDPDEDVESPTSYLNVNVVVRPWIVRTNTVIFGQGF